MGDYLTGYVWGSRRGSIEPFCRHVELGDILSAIRTEDCKAVFLTSDNGLGASSILQRLAKAEEERVPVVVIRGSQSLAKIPFGVLAPYISWEDLPSEGLRLGVLRQILAAIDSRQNELVASDSGIQGLPLVVVDDAHFIDEGTAELLVSLVMAGAVTLVASHSCRHKLPEPIPRLWARGLAENIFLHPLSQEQGHNFCEAMLDGPVAPATSWHFWSRAAGNPLFLHMLVAEALSRGVLKRQANIWVGRFDSQLSSRGLEDAVQSVLHGLSPEGQAALNIIALAEPLQESAFRDLVPAHVVDELLGWPLITFQTTQPDMLVLANPLYGHVIREMVPVSQSRALHQKLIDNLNSDTSGKESLLRRVLWALEVGLEVDDEVLLRAAVLATKLFQSVTALELAKQIRGKNFTLRSTMVQARAKYNLGDYRGAFSIMESLSEAPSSVQDLSFGSLLRASTRSALGMPVDSLLADARDLREVGERIAMQNPEDASAIRSHSESSALMVELIAHSRAGRYADMGSLTAVLMAQQGLSSSASRLNRAMALTMDAERLTAQGFPDQAVQCAGEAFAIEHSEENEVFFLPETIMLRQLTALLCSGHWSTATSVMEQFSIEDGPIIFSFGGGAAIVRGMAKVRAGAHAEALQILLVGIDSLRLSDPQQLLGYCTAMAAYCAARLRDNDLAAELLEQHVDSTGMYVVLAHERVFALAARHLLESDAGWLAEIIAQADAAQDSGSTLLELNALAMALELGEYPVAERVARVASRVEGPWARGLQMHAAALQASDAQQMREAAEFFLRSGAMGFAALASAQSLGAPAHSGGNKNTGERQPLQKTAFKGAGGEVPTAKPLGPATLTKREREAVTLAAQGLTDREIAQELSLAVRTVEGNLYRAYRKLGISKRDEINAAL